MTPLEEIRNERLKKLEILREKGINPYPSKAHRSHTIEQVLENFDALAKENLDVTLVGRVMVVRGQGAIFFVDFKDGTDRFQAVFKGDEIEEDAFTLFKDVVDCGDFIEISGTLFVTERGQQSVLVKAWRMLSKSLLPLPDKYHGLKNEEERLRKRYLDILQDDEQKALFRRRERFWDTARTFMKEQGFQEVETPSLEITTGGAEARPFKTHHNDFDIDVFLRISVGELWQKRLMAAGYEKTFEIGRVYRNEGTSPEHLQEFTNLEFYWAYADYQDGMEMVRDLYIAIANKVYGTTKFTYRDQEFDLNTDWVQIDYVSEIEKQTGVNMTESSDDEIKAKLNELGVQYVGDNRERLVDTLWKYCRKNIVGPGFVVNQPRLVAPLAKRQEGDGDFTQMFQPIIAGSEVGRGYSELNDPVDQKERFSEQQKMLEAGDEEAMMPDHEFVEMLEHGMPPTCGFGFGERFFAILENKPLRECQLFPLVKPKE